MCCDRCEPVLLSAERFNQVLLTIYMCKCLKTHCDNTNAHCLLPRAAPPPPLYQAAGGPLALTFCGRVNVVPAAHHPGEERRAADGGSFFVLILTFSPARRAALTAHAFQKRRSLSGDELRERSNGGLSRTRPHPPGVGNRRVLHPRERIRVLHLKKCGNFVALKHCLKCARPRMKATPAGKRSSV